MSLCGSLFVAEVISDRAVAEHAAKQNAFALVFRQQICAERKFVAQAASRAVIAIDQKMTMFGLTVGSGAPEMARIPGYAVLT